MAVTRLTKFNYFKRRKVTGVEVSSVAYKAICDYCYATTGKNPVDNQAANDAANNATEWLFS